MGNEAAAIPTSKGDMGANFQRVGAPLQREGGGIRKPIGANIGLEDGGNRTRGAQKYFR